MHVVFTRSLPCVLRTREVVAAETFKMLPLEVFFLHLSCDVAVFL